MNEPELTPDEIAALVKADEEGARELIAQDGKVLRTITAGRCAECLAKLSGLSAQEIIDRANKRKIFLERRLTD